jgi:hypothetical protein
MKRKKSSRTSQYRYYLIGLVAVVVVGLGVRYAWEGSSHNNAVPAASTAAARNDVRRANLKLMAGALNRYTAEVGTIPVAIPATQVGICSTTGPTCAKAGLVDLIFLTSKGYLEASPTDPVGGHDRYATGYTIGRNGPHGELMLAAPRAEASATISQVVR